MSLHASRKKLVRSAIAMSLAMLGALVLAFALPAQSDGTPDAGHGPGLGTVGMAIAVPVLIASSGLRP